MVASRMAAIAIGLVLGLASAACSTLTAVPNPDGASQLTGRQMGFLVYEGALHFSSSVIATSDGFKRHHAAVKPRAKMHAWPMPDAGSAPALFAPHSIAKAPAPH